MYARIEQTNESYELVTDKVIFKILLIVKYTALFSDMCIILVLWRSHNKYFLKNIFIISLSNTHNKNRLFERKIISMKISMNHHRTLHSFSRPLKIIFKRYSTIAGTTQPYLRYFIVYFLQRWVYFLKKLSSLVYNSLITVSLWMPFFYLVL